jgi:cytidylate kinase
MGATSDERAIERMRAVTISRQYGSGGGEVAARLARRLGWTLVDHQIVADAARQMGMREEEARKKDEDAPGFVDRLVNAVFLVAPPEVAVTPEELPVDLEHRYHETVRQIVTGAAEQGHVVIVGRGGQFLLAGHADALHVRIVAPLAQRIAYVALREGLDHDAARARVESKDRARVRYLQTYYHHDADDPLLYDLVLNSAILGLDELVDLIVAALADKAQQLGVPAAELGPAAGLGRYRGRPEDFRASWADD